MIIQIKIDLGMDVTYAGALDGLLVPLTVVAQTPKMLIFKLEGNSNLLCHF